MSEDVAEQTAIPAPVRAVDETPVSDPNRFKALFVIAIAQLMIVLDASIVNLAIPSAQGDLGITPQNVQWVVTAYTLAFGGFLLLGGRIADFVGRKRVFLIGLIGFAAASALGGMAMSPAMLFGARALQGAFAALLAPAALALITVTFHDPKERAKAFGVFGAISGGGAAIGLLMGGVLTEYLSWRWCLAVNTPIAVIAALLAVRFVRESKAHGDTSYDIPGAVTVTGGLLSLVYGFTQAAPAGYEDTAHWTDASTLVWFALAAVLLTAFFFIESRSKHPLLPLRVIRNSNRAGAYVSSLMVGAGMFAMFLFLGIFMQTILGYSPVRAGFAFLPFSVGVILGAGLAAQLLPRTGPRPLMIPGLMAGGSGMLWLAQLQADSAYVTHILPAMLIMSFGMAFVFIPTASVALHAIDHHDAGVGSAMINTSQQVGGSLGTALMNTVAVTATSAYLVTNASAGMPAALTHGFTRGFYAGAGLLFTAAVVVFFMIRIGADAVKEDDETPVHMG
ncbi:MAG: MFS transporter [Candidatus Nanopelagicales bacterium]